MNQYTGENDYAKALEAAGAKVLAFKEFGSYQGDWWAKVILAGETKWITGYYGSCSGCDAFQSEFGWNEEEEDPAAYAEKIKRFGQNYVEQAMSYSDAIKKACEHIEWDSDADEMVKWIREND